MNYNEYVSEYRAIPALLNYPKGEVLMRCLSKKSRLGTVVHAYNPSYQAESNTEALPV